MKTLIPSQDECLSTKAQSCYHWRNTDLYHVILLPFCRFTKLGNISLLGEKGEGRKSSEEANSDRLETMKTNRNVEN